LAYEDTKHRREEPKAEKLLFDGMEWIISNLNQAQN
jgi:hypothetical protein